MSSKTASGLVEYCRAQLGLPYWMGTYGQIATAALYKSNKARLPQYYTASDFPSQYGKRVHDCVGLIKGYRWSETPTSAPVYNASQDVPVSGLYAQCSRKGAIYTMPDRPGVCVFIPRQHVGVYIGGGYVIEARGHAYGVVKTKLKDRPWTQWGMPNWLTYDTATGGTSEKMSSVKLPVLSSGSSGKSVKSLQILLTGYDYVIGSVDGEFGPKTAAGVKLFQKANNITADGIVGPVTWSKLIYGS